MKFTADSAKLKDLITVADSLTDKGSLVFSDRYLKLSTLTGRLEISNSSQIHACTLFMDDVSIDTAGVLCAEFISPFIKELEDSDKNVSVSADDSKIVIKRGRKSGKIPAVPVANYIDRFVSNGVEEKLFIFKKAELQGLVQAAASVEIANCKNVNLRALNLKSTNNQLSAYFGDGITMFKTIIGTCDTEFEVNIPLQVLPKLNNFLRISNLAKDSAIVMLKTENSIIFKSSFGVFAAGLQAFSFPNVSSIFDTTKCELVNIPVAELHEHFKAADGLFKEYKYVVCNIRTSNDGNFFIVSNKVKDYEYEGEINNPDHLSMDFYVYADAVKTACSFIKEDANFFVRMRGNDVAMLGLMSPSKTFITVPIIKQKVEV